MNDPEPVWNECHFIMVYNVYDLVSLEVYHANQLRKDKLLGTFQFSFDEDTDSNTTSLEQRYRGCIACTSDTAPLARWSTFKCKQNKSIGGEICYGMNFYPIDVGTECDPVFSMRFFGNMRITLCFLF